MPEKNTLPFTESSFNKRKQPIQNLTTWAEEVVSRLFLLQWTLVGYATHPDGTVDCSRPYHIMTNPNSLIDNILARYSVIHYKYFSCIAEGFNIHFTPPFFVCCYPLS
jgi:hypothetical protein